MDGPFKFRQVVEEGQFEREKKKILKSSKRLDEILFGLTWALARAPESFFNVEGTSLYLAKTDAIPKTCSALYVWFTFDDETVLLRSIELAPKAE